MTPAWASPIWRSATGICPVPGAAPAGAAPGILCLPRNGTGPRRQLLRRHPRHGQFGPCFVQAYRLIKEVPGSFKCPDVYGLPHFDDKGNLIPYRYFQFGTGVRTWWSLNFTQPGTRSSSRWSASAAPVPPPPACRATAVIHKDSWIWRVVADVEHARAT